MENVDIAEQYYAAMAKKDLDGLLKFLHPDVRFKSPFFETHGVEQFKMPITKLLEHMKSLSVRAKMGSGDQVMLAYDIDFGFAVCPTAALLQFNNGLIHNIEIFFDTSPFNTQ